MIQGHHQTAIQTLASTIGYPQSEVIVLDALRKPRNLSDCSGEMISSAAAEECLANAVELLAHVRRWLAQHRPDLS